MIRFRRFRSVVFVMVLAGDFGCGDRAAPPPPPLPANIDPPPASVVAPHANTPPITDPRRNARPIAPVKTIGFPQVNFFPSHVTFTPGSPGAVVVSGMIRAGDAKMATHVVSLAPGAAPVRVPGDAAYEARRTVSPDLKWLAVLPKHQGAGNTLKLRVYAVADGAEVKAWEPYTGYVGGREPHLVDFGFVGPDRLVTVGSTGGLDVWDVPGFARRLGVPGGLPPFTSSALARYKETDNPRNYALGADGRGLAQFDGAGVRVYDPTTARLVASTGPLSPALTSVGGVALRADGSRVAVMYLHSVAVPNAPGVFQPEDVIAVWNTTTGAKVSENRSSYKFTELPRGIQWWGPDLLLMWDYNGEMRAGDVWSLATGRVVGRVRCGPLHQFQFGSPDDLLWASVAGRAVTDIPALLAVAPPPFTGNETYHLTRDGLTTAYPGIE